MSPNDDRRQRDLDLLMKSYKALESEHLAGDAKPEPEAAPPEPEDSGGDEEVMMYRGRPVRKGSGGIPGAGSSQAKGRQFRGAGGAKKKKPAGADQLKAALKKLNELHEEGLITKAEYDAKRRQILNRL